MLDRWLKGVQVRLHIVVRSQLLTRESTLHNDMYALQDPSRHDVGIYRDSLDVFQRSLGRTVTCDLQLDVQSSSMAPRYDTVSRVSHHSTLLCEWVNRVATISHCTKTNRITNPLSYNMVLLFLLNCWLPVSTSAVVCKSPSNLGHQKRMMIKKKPTIDTKQEIRKPSRNKR